MKSIQPKYATYQIDGTGRDMYISFNNGGSLRTVISYSQEKYQATPKRHRKNLSIQTKMIHYHNNGTGRDSYISEQELGNTSFLKGLRNYTRTYATPTKNRFRISYNNHFH